MSAEKSRQLFATAQQFIPGGVNSPVRAFKSVGGDPLFIARGEGAYLYDVDGNRYVDYVCSWGPLILGHAPKPVVEAVQQAVTRGASYGAPTPLEVELAQMICEAVPSIELVRMVNSGTEATMSAIRLARGYTKRDKIVKFDGCYHGHADALLVAAGSGVMTLGIPGSPGVPESVVQHTIQARFNDVDQFKEIVETQGKDIACVIVEPIPGNMGVVPPKSGFLEGLRELTAQHGIVLIFDEVISGFRVAYGGAQELYGITPDMTTLGKIIGGGLPVGAYGGRRDIMEHIAPAGPVYQAGTLSGNPVAMTAGIAMLKVLKNKAIYEELERKAQRLADGLAEAAKRANVPIASNRVGSMMTTFFTDQPVTDYDSAKTAHTQKYAKFFRAMLARGVYLAPSQFEAAFVSAAHSDEDIRQTMAAAEEAWGHGVGLR
jgi:glutamate-1-semialdehyde 2,1-aminomutase